MSRVPTIQSVQTVKAELKLKLSILDRLLSNEELYRKDASHDSSQGKQSVNGFYLFLQLELN